MRRNPYWGMYWRRWQARADSWTLLPLLMCCAALFLAVNSTGIHDDQSAYEWRNYVQYFARMVAVCWIVWLTATVVWCAASTFERERVQGTLELTALLPGSRRGIVWGHYGGAMLSVVEGWLLGLPIAMMLECLECAQHGLAAWVFSAGWLALLGAGALWTAVQTTSAARALALLPVMLAAMWFLKWVLFAGVIAWTSPTPPESGLLTAVFMSLPPSPESFDLLLAGAASPVLVLPVWLLSAAWIVESVAGYLKRDLPFRQAARASYANSGLLPKKGVDLIGVNRQPVPRGRNCNGFVDLLLWPLRNNPFYRSYREGFMRLYPTEIATPGSAFPPAVAIIALVIYLGVPLSGGVLFALFLSVGVGCLEAFRLAGHSLSAEREQGTWPLLMVSGVAPSRVLWGKFATTFYALSGEWTWTLPFWLAAAAWHQAPSVLLGACIAPACIALATVAGLWVSSCPLDAGPSPVRPPQIFAGLLLVAALLGPTGLGTTLTALWRLAIPSAAWAHVLDLAASPADFAAILASAAALTALAAAVWWSALSRLKRVMQGC